MYVVFTLACFTGCVNTLMYTVPVGFGLHDKARRFAWHERLKQATANEAQKKSQAVRLGIKDLIVAMDQGGVKHCQRGTLKQRGHSKKIDRACLWQLFSASVTECTAPDVGGAERPATRADGRKSAGSGVGCGFAHQFLQIRFDQFDSEFLEETPFLVVRSLDQGPAGG